MKQILSERYEIIELIGQGGMADVYLAKDLILNRVIALKMLRTSLAKDPVYVTRFQREANAAASLNHKNIVAIYDVGEDEGSYYIVMEYVPGVTLKELINRRGALHVVEAMDIMKQIASGVAKAHQLGIIHRDLKPQNVLVTESGVAKIADFGIASMQNLAQVTQNDVIMGSLHYLAPELARGEKATAQSDIYGLGIVLYELLRGEVPFHGESPVNIALKHMQEETPSIRDFNPTILQSVENCILKATAKNSKDRYANAMEFYEDLLTCLDRQDEEKIVFTYNPNTDPTIVVPSRGTVTQPIIQEEESLTIMDKFKQLGAVKKAAIILVPIALIAGIVAIFMFGGSKTVVHSMPDVSGMTISEATTLLETKYNVIVDENYVEALSNDVEVGHVISTNPEASKSVKEGDSVIFTISTGSFLVMPSYVGKDSQIALEDLQELGFNVTLVEVEEEGIAGTVFSQSIEVGTEIELTEELIEIELEVVKSEELTITDYTGMTFEKAESVLTALGFTVTREEVNSSELTGVVVEQSIEDGTVIVIEDETVLEITLTVSAGLSIEVPNVVGLSIESAVAKLESEGFIVQTVNEGQTENEGDVGIIQEQTPEPFSTVSSEGTVVTIYYFDSYVAPDDLTDELPDELPNDDVTDDTEE